MSQTLPRIEEVAARDGSFALTDEAVAVDGLPGQGSSGNRYLRNSQRGYSGSDFDSPVVELAIPVHNEGLTLEASVRALRTYLDESFPFCAAIRVIDNASTDDTWAVATRLASTISGVSALRLEQNGKGRAVRAAWSTSNAQIVAYMDVDLSTHLGALLPLVAPLLSGHSDVAIGSRLAPGAHVLRGVRRELVSRSYQFILRVVLRSRFSDATCGFKAARREAAEMLLPLVSDDHWFFDTELLVLAERNGFRIHEVPVDWIDDADSRVKVRAVACGDLKGIGRLLHSRATGRERRTNATDALPSRNASPGTRYAGVGVISTVAYLAFFLLLRHWVGTYAANVFALALSTVGNAVAHARFTFGRKSGLRMRQAFVAGGLSFITAVALTTLALGLEELAGTTSAGAEAVAIVVGTVAAGFVRLILLRASAYRNHTQSTRSTIAN